MPENIIPIDLSGGVSPEAKVYSTAQPSVYQPQTGASQGPAPVPAPPMDASHILGSFSVQKQDPGMGGVFSQGDQTRYPQYNPLLDNEEIYAQKQTAAEQLANSFIKMGTTALSAFGNGMLAIPDAIRTIGGGNAYKGEFSEALDKWSHNMEKSFPNYYSHWQQEHPFASMVPFSGGAANFWGDKVIKNLGFTIGAISSAVVTDALIGAATGGIGDIPLIANQVGKASLWLNKMFSGANNVEKALFEAYELKKVAGATDLGYDAWKATDASALTLKQIATLSASDKVWNGTRHAVTLVGASHAEAGMEARDGYTRVKKDLTDEFVAAHGYNPTGEDQKKIEDIATASGNARYGVNMALLTVSNALQFDAILKTFASYKNSLKTGGIASTLAAQEGKIGTVASDIKTAADIDQLTIKQLGRGEKIWSAIRKPLPNIFTEGVFEEGGQFAAERATAKYFEDKYQGKHNGELKDIINSTLYGLGEQFGTTQGLENMILGGITGMITTPATARFQEFQQKRAGFEDKKQATNAALQALLGPEDNPYSVLGLFEQNYNVTADGIKRAADIQGAINNNDIFQFKNLKAKAFFDFIKSGIDAGRHEVRIEQLNLLKELPEEEFNKMFGIESSERASASAYIDTLIAKATEIKQSSDRISKLFQNPFSYRGNAGTIKDEAKQLEALEQNNKYLGFEEYKKALNLYSYQVKDFNSRTTAITNSLQAINPAVTRDLASMLSRPDGLGMLATQYQQRAEEIQESLDDSDQITTKEERAAMKEQIKMFSTLSRDIKDITEATSYKEEEFAALHNKLLNFEISGHKSTAGAVGREFTHDIVEKGNDLNRINAATQVASITYDHLFTQDGYEEFMKEWETWKEGLNNYDYTDIYNQTDRPDTISVPGADYMSGRKYTAPRGRIASALDEVEVIRLTDMGFLEVRDKEGNIQFVKPSTLRGYSLVKTEEDLLAENEQIGKDAETLQEELGKGSSDHPTNSPEEDERTLITEKLEGRLKNLLNATGKSTTAPNPKLGDSGDYNRAAREIALHEHLVSNPELRGKLRVLPVTFNTQASLGFNFIEPTYTSDDGRTIDNAKDPVEGAIARVYVIDKGNGVYATIDHNGNELAIVGKSSSIEDIEKRRQKELGKIFVEDHSNSVIQKLFENREAGKPTVIRKGETFDIIFGDEHNIVTNKQEIETLILRKNPKANDNTVNNYNLTDDINKNRKIQFVIPNPAIEINAKYDKELREAVTNQDPNQFVFTFQENATPFRKGKNKFYEAVTPEQLKDVLNQQAARRTALFNSANPMSEIREFEISRGFPNVVTTTNDKGNEVPDRAVRNSVLSTGLIPSQDALSEKIWIEIPTQQAGDVATKGIGTLVVNGQDVKYPLGRPVLNRGVDFAPLQNAKVSKATAEKLFEIFKYTASQLVQGRTVPSSVKSYISSILYTGKNAPVFLGNGVINFGTTVVPITSAALDENKETIIAYLEGLYHNVNNKMLKEDARKGKWENFYEITGIENGEPTYRVWKSYQHFLLSDTYELAQDPNKEQGKARTDLPLTTNIQNKKEHKNTGVAEAPMIGKYLIIKDYFEYVPTVVKNHPAPKPAPAPASPTAPAAPQSGTTFPIPQTENWKGTTFVLDGETLNSVEFKNGTKVSFIASFKDGDIADIKVDDETAVYKGNGKMNAETIGTFISKVFDTVKPQEEVVEEVTAPETPTESSYEDEYKALQEELAKIQAMEVDPDTAGLRRIVDSEELVEAQWNESEFRTWMAQNLPQFNVNSLKNVIKATGGGYAWGAQRAKFIYIFENAPAGTEYHEAFEGVWNSFLDAKEQQGILKEFNSRTGSYIDRESGETINYADASAHQAKEAIAEEFAAFKTEGTLFKDSPKKMGFFQRLLQFIKNFIFGKAETVESLFQKIDSGYFRNHAFSGDATTTSYSRIRNSGVKVSEAWLNDTLHAMTDFMILKIKKDGNIIPFVEGRTSEVQVYGDLLGMVWGHMKKIDQTTNDALKKKILMGWGGSKGWKYVTDNWEDFVEEHKLFMKSSFGVTFKAPAENEVYIEQQTNDENSLSLETASANEENKNKNEYARDIFTMDSFEGASKAIRLIFSTSTEQEYPAPVNPNLENTQAKISLLTGARTLVDSDKEFMRVLNTVAGSSDAIEAERRVKELATTVPNLVPIVNTFFKNSPANRSFQEHKLIAQFWKAFGLQRPEATVQYTNENGETYTIEVNNNKQVDDILEGWSNFAKSLPIAEDHGGTYVINTSKIKASPNNPQSALAFLQEIGFPLTEEIYNKLPSDKDKSEVVAQAKGIYNVYKATAFISTNKGAEANERFKVLAGLVAKVNGDISMGSHMDMEKNIVQNNVLPNFTSKINAHINEAPSKEALLTRLPYLATDVHARHSLLLQDDQWNSSGRIDKLVNVVPNGATNFEGDSFPLSKVTIQHRFILEFNNNLEGNYFTLVPADVKQEWAINAGHYITINDFKHAWKPKLFSIFNNYLADEVDLVKDAANRMGNAEVAPNAHRLRFFKDILSPELIELFDEYIKDPQDVTTEDFILTNKDYIDGAVEAFLSDIQGRTRAFLKSSELISQAGDKFILEGIDTNFLEKMGMERQLTSQEIDDIIAFRTMNYVIHNIELHKVYFGDPAQFKDSTKRIKSFMSGREPMYHNDPSFNAAMNQHFNKAGEITLEQGTPGFYSFSESFRGLTVNHDEGVVSRNHAMYYKAFYDEARASGLNKIQATEQANSRMSKYETMEESDAQSWRIDTSVAEYLMRAGGTLSKEQEDFLKWNHAYTRLDFDKKGVWSYGKDKKGKALRKHDEELVATGKPSAVFSIDKPIGSGIINKNGIMESNLLKTSTMPLVYSNLEEGSTLQELYIWMWKNNIHYIGPKSQHKVGKPAITPALYNKATGRIDVEGLTSAITANSIVYEFPWEHFGKQVETAGESKSQTRISQLTALYKQDMYERGVPIDFNGKLEDSAIHKISMRNQEALVALTKLSYESILDKLGLKEEDGRFSFFDPTKFVNFIKGELTKRRIDDNTIQALGITYNETTNEYELSTPIEALNNFTAVKNLIWSVANHSLVSPTMNGGPKIQVSSAMWEKNGRQAMYRPKGTGAWKLLEKPYDKLSDKERATVRLTSTDYQFYTMDKDGKKIVGMEVGIPHWFKKQLKRSKKLRNMSDDELIAYLNTTEDGKAILEGVGARIPVQGMNAIDVFRVKHFLPAEMGDAIVLPSEVVAKAGSDFDVDKLSTYLKNVYVDAKGDLKIFQYIKDEGDHVATYTDIFNEIWDSEMASAESNVTSAFNLQNTLSDLVMKEGSEKNRRKWGNILFDMFETTDASEIEQELIVRLEKAGKKITKLNDTDIQEVLLDKFIYDARKKSLENEYFQSLADMISQPSNFTRLLSPNRTTETESVGEYIKTIIPKTTNQKKRDARGAKDINYSALINPLNMNRVRHINLIMKDGVGIAASQTKLFTMLQSADIKIAGTIKFPHNGDGKFISLSSLKDAEGVYVSDKNSQNVNGAVDAANGSWLAEQLGYFDLFSTAIFMGGAGVSVMNTYLFLRQPIIQEYMRMKSVNRAAHAIKGTPIMYKGRLKSKVLYKFGDVQEKNLPDIEEFTREDLESCIKDNLQLNEKQEIIQALVLREFLQYEEMARTVFTLGQGISWDTTRYKTNAAVDIKTHQYNEAVRAGIVGLEDLMNGTFIGEVKSNIQNVQKAYAPIFATEHPRIEAVLGPIKDTIVRKFMSKDKKEALMQKLDMAFINYVLLTQTNVNGIKLNNYISSVLLGKDNIVEKWNSKIATLKGDIKKNPAIVKLAPVLKNSVYGAKNIGMIHKPKDVFNQNTVTSAMREMRENANTADIYNSLVLTNFLQSGINNSRIAFGKFIPNEDYAPQVRAAINAMSTAKFEELEAFRTLNAFERNNWGDKTVVPLATPAYNPQSDENDILYFNTKELLAISPDGYSYLTLPTNSRNAAFKVVKTRTTAINPATGQKYTQAEKNKMAKNKDYSFVVTKLFQRVDDVIVTRQKREHVLYKQINAWGEGMNGQEYYTDNRPSVFPSNLKVDEMRDIDIEMAVNGPNIGLTIEDMQQTQSTEASTIYGKLGNKTASKNVRIKSVYQTEGINYAKSIGGVFALRVNNSSKHFGNPFSSVPKEIAKGLVATKSTRESVERYIDWVLNSSEERAVWIRSLLKSGDLKNKPIVYYTELGEPSHATALDYLINEHDWDKASAPLEGIDTENDAPFQVEQTFEDFKNTLKTKGC